MSEFEQLCESMGVIKTIKRERYPREIRLSEEFLEALKKEFYHHKLEEDATKPVRNYPEKFSKALRFEISHLNDRADIELAAMRQKFEEMNDERVPEVEVDGEEMELAQNDAPKNTPPKEDNCKCKRLVLKRNVTPEPETTKIQENDEYYEKHPERYYWADERGWIDKRTGEIVKRDTRQEDRHNRSYSSYGYGRRRRRY